MPRTAFASRFAELPKVIANAHPKRDSPIFGPHRVIGSADVRSETADDHQPAVRAVIVDTTVMSAYGTYDGDAASVLSGQLVEGPVRIE